MKIRRWDVYQLALPFRVPFTHAQAVRRHSASIIVRCELADGSVGFGEGLPREYVTGESWRGCFMDLACRVLPRLTALDFASHEEVEAYGEGLYDRLLRDVPELPRHIGATCCAAELALLDAYGRHFGQTAFAGAVESSPVYSGVIPASGTLTTLATAWACRRYAMPAVKLKLGAGREARVTRLVRAVLGPRRPLRVDANMAWTLPHALDVIPQLQRLGVHYVEQPLPAGRYEDSRRLQEATGAALVADEDLCDEADAYALVRHKACAVFNVRLSKCGGFFRALRLGRFAREHGLQIQVGCQVGESALLSAAGLAAARRLAPVLFAEGCFGTRLLAEDLLAAPDGQETFEFRHGGMAPFYQPTAGLGITVDERRLARHAHAHARIDSSGSVTFEKQQPGSAAPSPELDPKETS